MKAPSSTDWPLEVGTRIEIDTQLRLTGERLVLGGSPWRALSLSPSARALIVRWQREGVVRAGEERFARTLTTQGLVHPRFAPAPDTREITVVVPFRGDLAPLFALGEDLRDQRVIVVDDASGHGPALREFTDRLGFTLMERNESLGPSVARNDGFGLATTDFVAFVDADVRLRDASGTLRRLASHFADPLVGAVAPRVRGTGGGSARQRFEQRFSPLDLGPHSAVVRPRARVSYVPSACLLVRRTAFGEGFDSSLRVGEDVDAVWRLDAAGWLVRYDADVVVEHATRPTLRAWCTQRLAYGASAATLTQRHPTALAPLHADVWTLAAWGTLVAGRPRLAGQLTSAISRRALERAHEVDPAAGRDLVRITTLDAGGPLARALTRHYGPALLALAALPLARRRLLALYGVGTLWRWRHEQLRPTDVVLGTLDDLLYSLGLIQGAFAERTLAHLTPDVTFSSLSWRHLVARPMLPSGPPKVRSDQRSPS